MAAPLRVVFYAINGSGLGHVTRLLAIARALRELLEALDLKADVRFLTTTEATSAIWDFPVYKLPSYTVVGASSLDRRAFLANSRLLVINLVASLQPDLLVVDTVPHGAFGEMSMLAGHAAALVYIDRHKEPALAQSELHLRHLPLYEKILVPDDADQWERYPLPLELANRRRFVGAVHGFQAQTTLSRQAVHSYFAIPEGRRLLFLSAGGGGDEASRAELTHLADSLAADSRNHLLVGYGPLHRGPCLYRTNLITLQENEISRYFGGIDAAISAAGYNSYQELLAARVPTAFFAQPKGMDRQDERIQLGLDKGWHTQLPYPLTSLPPEELRGRVEELLSGSQREQILATLEDRPPAQGALRAATELLLLPSAAGRAIPRGELLQAALQRAAWKGNGSFALAARAWRTWAKLALKPSALAEGHDRAAAAWREPGSDTITFRLQGNWGARLVGLPTGLLRAWCPAAGDEAQERESRERLGEALDELEQNRGREGAVQALAELQTSTDLRGDVSRLLADLDDPSLSGSFQAHWIR